MSQVNPSTKWIDLLILAQLEASADLLKKHNSKGLHQPVEGGLTHTFGVAALL